MMMSKAFWLVVAFCASSMVVAQSDAVLVPKAPLNVSLDDLAVVKILQVDSEPMVVVAKFIQKETVAITMVREISYLQEKRKRTVTVDGKQVEQEYTVNIPVSTDKPTTVKNFTPTRQERFCTVNGVQVFDLNGKLVEPDVWTKLLQKPRHVLLLKEPIGEKNPLDPFYVSIIREDTLLMFLPKQAADVKTE
ncbi:MAG: hypothetical protein ABL921_01440 [Pirellula sp.]